MEKRSWPWKKKISEKSLMSSDHPVDEKIRLLNERLRAADDLAKQHATVAEEAVSGWEKTKAEYMSVKYQLDNALEQKQAAEVRLFHLDGALKESMQQLRQVREEQEQTIHEAIVKRSREWDKVRLDLQERLADVEGQLVDTQNQKALLYKAGQERAEAVAELGRVRAEAEGEIKKLQVQIQTFEKENTSLKYEIVVLNKELGIRTQEREMNSRALDLASQQHAENTKRISKLENECQRLRALVRKKLPGPGALLQMKLEAGMDAERGDNRRSNGRGPSSPTAAHADLSSERLLALEEESQSLKQALNKKNKELQTARLLCGQKGKLSSNEGQAGVHQRPPRMVSSMSPRFHATDSFSSKEHTHIALSDDGHDDDQSVADSWTGSISTELSSCFEIERLTPQQPSSNGHSVQAYEKLNSIDDFLEIERLVSLPSEKQGVKPIIKVGKLSSSVSEQVHGELDAAKKLSPDLRKETHALSVSGNGPLDLRISRLQESSPVGHCPPELTTLIWKVIRIVEDLASKTVADLRDFQPSDDVNGHNDIQYKPKLQLAELEANLKSFNASGNAYLYGKAELVQFMAELYSVLDRLNALPRAYKPLSSRMKWRPEAVQIAEQEVLSDVGSPFSVSSNSDRCDSLARKDSSVDERLASRIVRAEKGASEFRPREGLSGVATMEHVIVELKREKIELEKKLKEERSKVESMKGQLSDSEQLVVSLRARLASAELSGIVAEKSLASITATKAQLEMRLQGYQLEVGRMREKVKDLEIRIEQERRRSEEFQESRALQRTDASILHDDTEKSVKENDIADATEKLAQCQRSIFVLGQQLKDMASTQDGGPFITYLNDDKAECLEHATLPNAERRSPSDPVACSMSEVATDELAFSAGMGSEKQEFDVPDASPLYKNNGFMKSPKDLDKQIVPYAPRPASKKKLNLHPFAGSSMSKSLNLEPCASPRKHANSFSKFFSRHKSPS